MLPHTYVHYPALYVLGKREYEMARMAFEKAGNIHRTDYVIMYNYQRKVMDLLASYIAPHLNEKCPVGDTYQDTLEKMDKEPLKDKFKVLLMKYMQKNKSYDKQDFMAFLDGNNYIFFDRAFKSERVFFPEELTRYYETIIMDISRFDGNRWNRFFNLPPNYSNLNRYKLVLKSLREAGDLVFADGVFRDKMALIYNGGYDFEEIKSELRYRKKRVYKEPYEPIRLGL